MKETKPPEVEQIRESSNRLALSIYSKDGVMDELDLLLLDDIANKIGTLSRDFINQNKEEIIGLLKPGLKAVGQHLRRGFHHEKRASSVF